MISELERIHALTVSSVNADTQHALNQILAGNGDRAHWVREITKGRAKLEKIGKAHLHKVDDMILTMLDVLVNG